MRTQFHSDNKEHIPSGLTSVAPENKASFFLKGAPGASGRLFSLSGLFSLLEVLIGE